MCFSRIYRLQTESEIAARTEFLRALLTCEFAKLPIEAFAHPMLYESTSLRSVYFCLQQNDATTTMLACKQSTREWCSGVQLAATRHCAEIIEWFRTVRPQSLDADTLSRFATAFPDLSETTVVAPSGVINVTFNGSSNATRPSEKRMTVVEMFFEHYRCIRDLDAAVRPTCIETLGQAICNETLLIAVEAVRLQMTHVDRLLKLVPDLQVIHYVRDPRAITVSRSHNVQITLERSRPLRKHQRGESDDERKHPAASESRVLCDRMTEDLRAARSVLARFPNSLRTMRYEDLVLAPNETVAELFGGVVGRLQPLVLSKDPNMEDDLKTWLTKTMNAPIDADQFGIQRRDGPAMVSRWTRLVNYRLAKILTNNCLNVIDDLGYER